MWAGLFNTYLYLIATTFGPNGFTLSSYVLCVHESWIITDHQTDRIVLYFQFTSNILAVYLGIFRQSNHLGYKLIPESCLAYIRTEGARLIGVYVNPALGSIRW